MKFFNFCFHEWEEIEDIAVFEENNPYASMGQLQVCIARQCKKCAKIQVKSHGIYNSGWQNIKSFIIDKREHDTQNDDVARVTAIVNTGTPIVHRL